MSRNLMSFLPQAVVESRYDTDNPIHKIYLFVFNECGKISRVKYDKYITVDIIVQFPNLKGGTSDLTMVVKIPR